RDEQRRLALPRRRRDLGPPNEWFAARVEIQPLHARPRALRSQRALSPGRGLGRKPARDFPDKRRREKLERHQRFALREGRPDDEGCSWSKRGHGLAATTYYDLHVAPGDPRSFGGGAQDNGTVVTATGSSDDHFEIEGGDGGWIVYHPAKANWVFASYYNMNI